MSCLLRAHSAALFSRTSRSVASSYPHVCWSFLWSRNLKVRATDFDIFLTRCYSRKSSKSGCCQSQNPDPKPAGMKDEEDAFFVVRKGDIVGVYRSLSDCQAQLGSSICDTPVSVYKGCSLPNDTKEYLVSHGLKNAMYSIRAADLKEDLFGLLVPCPLQEAADKTFVLTESGRMTNHTKSNNRIRTEVVPLDLKWCIIEFDGACKGNPGQAGAGAVLRTVNGRLICRLREGLGKATSNVAEYRAMILGLKCALQKGYTHVRVQGDSQMVCQQLQGRWKVKNKNLSELYKQAEKLKENFLSFEVVHVLRELNTEADAQANWAAKLDNGQIEEEVEAQMIEATSKAN